MPADSILVFLLLFVSAGAGWFGARWYAGRGRVSEQQRVNPGYLRGLSYLLEDKPDKAIEVFVSLIEVDNETIETHFALGSLFRRRGEVDRAIRIHQNIIARPNLPRAQRDQALHALAEDYLRAGLLDRAEKLFDRLVASPSLKGSALEKLIGIYEQQHDWNQAIAVRGRLDRRGPDNERIIAHYYCELAAEAAAEHDHAAARVNLKKARATGAWQPRGALMRARLALSEGDQKAAARLFRRVVESDGKFITEVWPAMRDCLAAVDGEGGFGRYLETLLRKQPDLNPDVAYAAIVHADLGSPAAARCVEQLIRGTPPLEGALLALEAIDAEGPIDRDRLDQVAAAIAALLANRSAYHCHHCGYQSDQLYWQCPGCKSWDTIRPNTRLSTDRLALGDGK